MSPNVFYHYSRLGKVLLCILLLSVWKQQGLERINTTNNQPFVDGLTGAQRKRIYFLFLSHCLLKVLVWFVDESCQLSSFLALRRPVWNLRCLNLQTCRKAFRNHFWNRQCTFYFYLLTPSMLQKILEQTTCYCTSCQINCHSEQHTNSCNCIFPQIIWEPDSLQHSQSPSGFCFYLNNKIPSTLILTTLTPLS